MIHQVLSDELRNRNKKACYKLFGTPGYFCLLSRYVAHSEEERSAKRREIIEEKSKLLRKWDNGIWDYSHRRRTSIFQLCQAGIDLSFLSNEFPTSTDVLSIFGHVVAVNVLQKYVGCSPQVIGTSQSFSSCIDGRMLTLARLDAYISTVIYFFV